MTTGADDKRNWFERIAEKIPGYSGYVDRERRRDIDKMHRDHLSDRLRRLKSPLSDIIRDLSSTGRVMEVDPLDRATKKLDRLENRIRFASYGYRGFFDVVKIEQQQLDSIYGFDLALLDEVEGLEAAIGGLKSSSSTETLKSAVGEIISEIDRIDRVFDDRYKAINEFGQDRAPGKPLFGG